MVTLLILWELVTFYVGGGGGIDPKSVDHVKEITRKEMECVCC